MSGECDKCGNHTLECICKFINECSTEDIIKQYENQLLGVLKARQKEYPSKKNDKEWLDFSDYVIKRRYEESQEK